MLEQSNPIQLIHDLGRFTDLAALQSQYPAGRPGDFARLTSTETIWNWNGSEWIDTSVDANSLVGGKFTFDNTNPNSIGNPPSEKLFQGAYEGQIWVKDSSGNVNYININGFRIDEFTYNETTEEIESVVNTYQDIFNYAKPAVVDENNQVLYYLNRNDVRFKENGEAANIYGYTADTVKNIGGTDYTILAADFGNVVIRFPKMYYGYGYLSSKHNYRMSMYNFAGSQVHPAFKRYDSDADAVVTVDYCNIGRYEGVLFDYSADRCVNGIYIDTDITAVASTKTITPAAAIQYIAEGDVLKDITGVIGAVNAVYTVASVTRDANYQTTEFTVNEAVSDVGTATAISFRNDIDTANDKLMSVSGYKPVTYISQIEARALAGNNGSLYSQQVYSEWFLVQMLAAVKYETLNIQTALGAGKTSSTGDYKYVSVTGLSDSSGMADFIDNTTNKELEGGSSIFGIENLYGNIWKWLDGMNIEDWMVHLSNDNSQFGTSGSYENTGIELPHSNGYWAKLQNTDKGILPASIDGDSANDIGDYFYQNSGSRVGLVGGYLAHGSRAGLSALYCYGSASFRSWDIGARVRS